MDDIELVTGESSSSYSDSSVEDRENTVNNTLTILEREHQLICLDNLGHGTYGDVFHMFDVKSNAQKAAKIIVQNNTVALEQEIWPELNHANVLIVEELLTMTDGTIVFLTPLKFKTLYDIVLDKVFQEKYEQNHKALKKWLKDALSGIEYMHSRRYCHLDIKLDNVLVGHDGRACICDFSFINYHDKPLPLEDVGLPEVYRPPEVFRECCKRKVDGRVIDMWAYGIMVAESYTNQYLLENVDDCQSWMDDVRPVLEAILEDDTFNPLVRYSFPSYPFTDSELQNLLNFIDLFIQFESKNRTLAKQALGHRFLQDIDDFVVVLSDIYSAKELNGELDEEWSSPEDTTEQIVKEYSKWIPEVPPKKIWDPKNRFTKQKACFKINIKAKLVKAKIKFCAVRGHQYRATFRKGLNNVCSSYYVLKKKEMREKNAGDGHNVQLQIPQKTDHLLELKTDALKIDEETSKPEINFPRCSEPEPNFPNYQKTSFPHHEDSISADFHPFGDSRIVLLEKSSPSSQTEDEEQTSAQKIITTQNDVIIMTGQQSRAEIADDEIVDDGNSTVCPWLGSKYCNIICFCTKRS